MAKDNKRLYIKEQPFANLYALYTWPDDEELVFCGTSTELNELGIFHFYSSDCRGSDSVIVNGTKYKLHVWKMKDLEKLDKMEDKQNGRKTNLRKTNKNDNQGR